jgi:hypothetical protein
MGYVVNRFIRALVDPLMRLLILWEYVIAYGRYALTPRERLPDLAPLPELREKTIAIVALHQVGTLCRNCEAMLQALADEGLALLVINNGALGEAALTRIRTLATLYHERRPGLGRDFASYRLGVRIVDALTAGRRADPPRIVFANDSVLIIPDRYRAFLPRFLAETSPVVGVTETDEKNYHISSWLFSVSRELWQQPFFRRYWRKLRPIHCRRHTIRAGELRLSACLTYHRVPFALMYPASVFMAALQKLPATAIEETLQYLPYGFLKGDPAVLAAESFRDVRWRVLSAQRGTNQTAFWQLVGLLHADFPFVKKDIYYRGVFSLAQMRLFFDAFDAVPDPDKHYIRDRVMAVRDPRTFGPVEKLRFLAGLE